MSIYICNVCGASYAQSPGLSRHRKKTDHRAAQPRCEWCGLETRASALLSHRRSCPKANGLNGGFVCLTCSAAFGRITGLTHHVQRRGHDAGFRCPECELSLATECAVAMHLTQVHGIGPKTLYPCTCEYCGARIERTRHHLRFTTPKGHQLLCISCRNARQSERNAGDRNPGWIDGRMADAESRKEIRDWWKSREGRVWRRAVGVRAGWRCELCGKQHERRGRCGHAHHKAGWTRHPHLRGEVCNGRFLCRGCHQWVHSAAGESTRFAWEQDALYVLGRLAGLAPLESTA